LLPKVQESSRYSNSSTKSGIKKLETSDKPYHAKSTSTS